MATAVISTIVVFTAIGLAIVNSPGWPAVREAFLNGEVFRASFPDIARAFKLNVEIFLVCEVFILILALIVAVLRSLPGPVFFPLRALAVIYSDLARGAPKPSSATTRIVGIPRARSE